MGLLVLPVPNIWASAEPAPGSKASVGTPEAFRFAMVHVLGGVNPRDARVAIDINWSRHLAEIIPGIDSHFETLPNISVAAKKIQSNQLHGLSMGIAQYLQLSQMANLKPIFISSRMAGPLESYLLVVNRDTDWKGLGSQSQRRLITEKMAEPNIGLMWLETVLKDRDMPQSNSYFHRISSGAKPARIILPVFFGQADACLVPESAFLTMAELNPQIRRRLTILERSPGFIKTIHCATDLIPQDMLDVFIDEGVTMDNSVDGRQLLLIFQVKTNFVFKQEYLTNSERIYRKYQKIVR